MRLRGVDVPDELIRAQEEGRLVVFAGAGVSMSPPTCAPSFGRLVEGIAGDSGVTREDGEPCPDFLGRLESLNIPVRDRARKIIGACNGQPSRLHEAILRLFPTSDNLKIVTTNFDTLFTTACAKTFGEKCVRCHCAPYPPVGTTFSGIVYLHGSLDKPDSLILTDEDYGRAYLSEDDGWATRFLRRLFHEYTVLFVGYSHGDMPVRYLEAGLRREAGGGRFAFVDSTDVASWANLGITPITYSPDSQHTALHQSLTLWGDVLDKDYLRHYGRIKAIVAQDPPEAGEDLDYIDLVLRHRILVQFFTRHADGPKWLKFVEERQLLAPLFQIGTQVDEISQHFAHWFAEKYARRFPVEALDLVGRNNQRMSLSVWRAVLHDLWTGKPKAEARVLASWVVVLLQSAYQLRSPELGYLLRGCRHPEDDLTAVILFDYLTQPWLAVRKPWFPVQTDADRPIRMDWDIRLRGDTHHLNKAWDERFRPNLDAFVEKLAPIVENNLRHIYGLLSSVGKITDEWDPISWGRQRIWEDHSSHDDEVDILITMMRHILDWIIDHEPERALIISKAWWHSNMLIFNRLGIYGISRSPSLASEQKIDWLLDQKLLYDMGLKPDVFHFLQLVYQQLDSKGKAHLLEVASVGPVDHRDRIGEDTFRYEIYNLLYWIHLHDPADALAEESFRAVQEQNPGFGPRKYPDLNHWIETGGYEPPPPPKNAQQLLDEDAALSVDFLLTYRGDEGHAIRSSRSELLDEVSQAVSRSLEWGCRLAGELAQREEWESDLWDQILQGWEQASLKVRDWRDILAFLLRDDVRLHQRPELVARFLKRTVSRDKNRIPLACIPMAEDLAEKVWLACRKDSAGLHLENESWYITASQHAGGMLTEFMIWALSRRRQQAGDKWTGIPRKHRRFMSRSAREDTAEAEMSCVVLGRHLYFLQHTDATWVATEIVPGFDWSAGERRAEMFWHGFLSQTRLGDALFLQLLPYYLQTMERVTKWPGLLRNMFANHVANAAMYLGRNPLEEGLLLRFIGMAEPADREEWASVVLRNLTVWEPETVERTWNDWLRDYWSARIEGRPVPLDVKESETMLRWVLYLDPVFDEAVSLACKSSVPDEVDSFMLSELAEKGFAVSRPRATADLLLYLMENARVLYDCDCVEQMVRDLATQDVGKLILRRICSELARLGCPGASKLGDLIDQ